MAITVENYVDRVLVELRITPASPNESDRVKALIAEAAYSLQQFKCKTLVDSVTDAATQTAISPLDLRYIVIYVAIQYDGGDDLAPALSSVLEQVREK
jgi:hypothetical protein